jgi:hypothetical protein
MAAGGDNVRLWLLAVSLRMIAEPKSISAGVLRADCHTNDPERGTYVAEAGDNRLVIEPGVPTTAPDWVMRIGVPELLL